MSRPETPPFDAPWQAQAFAMTVALVEAGHLSWSEWSEALGARLNAPDAARDGSDYYDLWLATLAELVTTKRLTTSDRIEATTQAWQRAARATPHGQPIELAAEDRF